MDKNDADTILAQLHQNASYQLHREKSIIGATYVNQHKWYKKRAFAKLSYVKSKSIPPPPYEAEPGSAYGTSQGTC